MTSPHGHALFFAWGALVMFAANFAGWFVWHERINLVMAAVALIGSAVFALGARHLGE